MATFSPGLGRVDRVSAGTPDVPAPGVLLFGRYRLDERLGQGGMAEVWRARDEDLDRLVAIKVLHRHLLPDERSRERFAAEARAVAGLSHPGILTVHDIVLDDQQAAIVMELVDGEPLSDVIAREGRVAEVGAAAITAQVAYALQAAHDRGLVHRDVKPANVLLSADGRARLVDFGIARALDDRESALTLPGTIMGTLRYMAPEQLSDGAADRATDVFGLGSLLYEMLVGRPPFPGATPAALMAQQRQGAPAIFRVSPELAGLARTALQPDPERRPRSAGLMAALLERWLEHRGVSSLDLPAVAAAAMHGTVLPKSPPAIQPRPAITPAPILEPAAAVVPEALPVPKPKRRRTKAVAAAEQLALGANAGVPGSPATGPTPTTGPAAADIAAAEASEPAGGASNVAARTATGSDPTIAAVQPVAAPIALAAAADVAAPTSPALATPVQAVNPAASAGIAGAPDPAGRDLAPPHPFPGDAAAAALATAETAAVPATRRRAASALRLGGRRVPLVTAIGLAGVLLAFLLLAGALAALQAGTVRPSQAPTQHPTATVAPTPSPVAATPRPTAAPVVAPVAPAATPKTPPGRSGPGKDEKPGKPKGPPRRDNTN